MTTQFYHLPYTHSYIKYYPNQTKLFIFNKPIKKRDQNELPRRRQRTHTDVNSSAYHDSLRRTETRIADYVLSNNFSLFITFTFSPKKIDRTDENACRKALTQWLKYQKIKNPNLKYLLVPEKHKDGSIHFHGLTENYTPTGLEQATTPTGIKLTRTGKPLYNLTHYKLGHSTASPISQEDLPIVATYIKKYLTKDLSTKLNKKRYWPSKNLNKPTKEVNPNITHQQFIKHIKPNSTTINHEHLTIYTVPYNLQLQLTSKETQPCQTKPKNQPKPQKILSKTLTPSRPESNSSKPTPKKAPATNISAYT